MAAENDISQRALSWFPGHMVKAQRRLAEEVKNADVVLEVRDARLPMLSGNPELERLIGGRKRMVLFNKASLADPAETRRWQARLKEEQLEHLFLDADSRKGLNLIFPRLRSLCAPLENRYRQRGIRPPSLRLMVVGMPNVGKSTLINRMLRERKMKTAPMPGVTRSIRWVALKDEFLLMDSPGIMLPRLDNPEEALKLGWIGALKDTIIGVEDLAKGVIGYILSHQFGPMLKQYGLEPNWTGIPEDFLAAVCARRGLLNAGGIPDFHTGSEVVLEDFRAGRLGLHTLEPALPT